LAGIAPEAGADDSIRRRDSEAERRVDTLPKHAATISWDAYVGFAPWGRDTAASLAEVCGLTQNFAQTLRIFNRSRRITASSRLETVAAAAWLPILCVKE